MAPSQLRGRPSSRSPLSLPCTAPERSALHGARATLGPSCGHGCRWHRSPRHRGSNATGFVAPPPTARSERGEVQGRSNECRAWRKGETQPEPRQRHRTTNHRGTPYRSPSRHREDPLQWQGRCHTSRRCIRRRCPACRRDQSCLAFCRRRHACESLHSRTTKRCHPGWPERLSNRSILRSGLPSRSRCWCRHVPHTPTRFP